MTEKKSIIDRVLEEQHRRKKEEFEQQERERQEENIRQSNLQSYIHQVLGTLERSKPEYNPRGLWLGSVKWSISSTSNSIIAIAKNGLTRKSLAISVTSTDHLSLADCNDHLGSMARRAVQEGDLFYMCTCIIAKHYDETVPKVFTAHKHHAISAILYNLDQHTLIYNEENWNTWYYSHWFDPKKQPLQMIDLLLTISDDHQVFTVEKLKTRFHFDEREADRMLNQLMEQHLIMRMKRGEYGVIQ